MEPQLIPSAIFFCTFVINGWFPNYKNPTTESVVCICLLYLCDHWIRLDVAQDFECVAACCSVMRRDVVICRVLLVSQCAIEYGSVWQSIAARHIECAAVWYSSVLQCVAVCRSMLKCVVARHFECVAVCVAVCCRP